jgi:hypothetical protein
MNNYSKSVIGQKLLECALQHLAKLACVLSLSAFIVKENFSTASPTTFQPTFSIFPLSLFRNYWAFMLLTKQKR